jgi:hypothetical protein
MILLVLQLVMKLVMKSRGDEWKGDGTGIWRAIEEFLDTHPEWVLKERFTHNNGFTIIEKVK